MKDRTQFFIGGNWVGQMGLADVLTLSPNNLVYALVIYGFVASILPVWMLLAPRDHEPILLGYHEAGFWFFSDGMVVGSPYTVTHWTDMPEVNHG